MHYLCALGLEKKKRGCIRNYKKTGAVFEIRTSLSIRVVVELQEGGCISLLQPGVYPNQFISPFDAPSPHSDGPYDAQSSHSEAPSRHPKWPPRGPWLQNRLFLNKSLTAGNHSGTALAQCLHSDAPSLHSDAPSPLSDLAIQNGRRGPPEALGSKIVFLQ